jgi:type I restriction enzyme S subunit
MTATLPSLEKLKTNPDWALLPLFDRTGWMRVRFGEVVENCNETCNPGEAGLERFVAMEHLEPGSLHIRSWGNVADGTTFTRRCRPGQVLFGKRRAYQRKVAVAEFEAVVSGDIYVLAPKDDRLLAELLPFLCLSERFFQHAVGTSAGSLSPRTNWSSLASFEFDLPPLDQQRRIAEILWAVDEVTKRSRELLDSVKVYEDAFVRGRMGIKPAVIESLSKRQKHEAEGWLVTTGQDLLDRGILIVLKDGNHGEQYPRSSEFSKIGTPYVAASNITDDGKIDFDSCPKLTDIVKARLRIPPARGGDVLLTHNATVGRVAIIPDSQAEVVASTTTTYYRPNPERLSNLYLAAYLRTHLFQSQLHRVMKQSTRDQVNPLNLRKTGHLGLAREPVFAKICNVDS